MKNLPILILSLSTLLIAGCSSLGGGSVAQRSAKLASGIERAYAVESTTARRVAPLIVQHADQYEVDPLLMAALIQQESSYRNYVVSSAGAVGLTQVVPRYWQEKCPGDLFDEYTNVRCGTYILASYNQATGSWKKALAYYNVGPTAYENSFWTRHKGKKYARSVQEKQKILKQAL